MQSAAREGGLQALAGKDCLIFFTGMRKTIADRMMQSLQGMTQTNHRMKVEMSEVVRFRDKLKESGIRYHCRSRRGYEIGIHGC